MRYHEDISYCFLLPKKPYFTVGGTMYITFSKITSYIKIFAHYPSWPAKKCQNQFGSKLFTPKGGMKRLSVKILASFLPFTINLFKGFLIFEFRMEFSLMFSAINSHNNNSFQCDIYFASTAADSTGSSNVIEKVKETGASPPPSPSGKYYTSHLE